MIASFVRGLATRDVDNTLAEALGSDAALSKSTVSNICQAIRGEYDAWWMRDLTGVTLDYLFIDASHFRMHPNAPAEPVLAAWGIDTDGKPVFIGLEAASESHDAWVNFSAGLRDRGLEPLLWSRRSSGRSSIPPHSALPPASCSSTPSSAASANSRRSGRRPTRPRPIPFRPTGIHSPLTCGVPPSTIIASGTPALSSGPSARSAAASSAASPGETSCVSLAFAVLSRAATGWRGFTTTRATVRQLERMRRDLLHTTEAEVTHLAPRPPCPSPRPHNIDPTKPVRGCFYTTNWTRPLRPRGHSVRDGPRPRPTPLPLPRNRPDTRATHPHGRRNQHHPPRPTRPSGAPRHSGVS